MDDRETKRRTNEEALRVDRRHKLLFEAESSARRNAAITMKWTVLYQIEVQMDLHQEMKAQEAACWRIIEAKDNLIRDFQANPPRQPHFGHYWGLPERYVMQDSMIALSTACNACRADGFREYIAVGTQSKGRAVRQGAATGRARLGPIAGHYGAQCAAAALAVRAGAARP